MKRLLKISGLALILFFGTFFSSAKLHAQDSEKIRVTYSLFSEYHKNKDYQSALPYGWEVLSLDPEKLNKWIYYKMEDALWYLHDSSDAAEEDIAAIQDSIVPFYNLAIQHYPEQKGYFQVRKAFVMETWLNADPDSVIKEYEQAFEWNPELSTYYYHHRLGQLYKVQSENKEDYKTKALDLYSALSEKEPDNPQWPAELENLVDNIDQLVDLTKKAWEFDKENLQKAWKYASLALKANRQQEAVAALEFLIGKSPETVNYWQRLAEAYQKTDQIDKAESALKKLIQLEPGNKNHPLNLGIVYMDKNQYAASRTQFLKASEIGGGWGLPIYYEGFLYEKSARACEFDFDAKKVYQLAVDTYRRAKNMDPTVSAQAQERITALANSVPTQEDYFFRGFKSGQSLPITGSCFGWVGKSITVP